MWTGNTKNTDYVIRIPSKLGILNLQLFRIKSHISFAAVVTDAQGPISEENGELYCCLTTSINNPDYRTTVELGIPRKSVRCQSATSLLRRTSQKRILARKVTASVT